MGVKWTPEQESAIIAPKDSSLDNQTLLVAAAAGSGKTAVLVERIITRLKDMDNPLSVQELMVVTFTKATAQSLAICSYFYVALLLPMGDSILFL